MNGFFQKPNWHRVVKRPESICSACNCRLDPDDTYRFNRRKLCGDCYKKEKGSGKSSDRFHPGQGFSRTDIPVVREEGEFCPFQFNYACEKGIIEGNCKKNGSGDILVSGSYMTNGDSVPMAVGTEWFSFSVNADYMSLHMLAGDIASKIIRSVGYGNSGDLREDILRGIADAQRRNPDQ